MAIGDEGNVKWVDVSSPPPSRHECPSASRITSLPAKLLSTLSHFRYRLTLSKGTTWCCLGACRCEAYHSGMVYVPALAISVE